MELNKLKALAEAAETEASKEYQRELKTVRASLAKIEKGLEKHVAKQAKRPTDWGLHGDMAHMAKQLKGVADFLNGTGEHAKDSPSKK